MTSYFDYVLYVIGTLVIVHMTNVLVKRGFECMWKEAATFIIKLPGVEWLISMATKQGVKKYMNDMVSNNKSGKEKKTNKIVPIPEKGESADFLRKELVELKEGNKDLSKKGRLFAFVYTSEGIQFELQKEAFKMFTNLTYDDEKYQDLVETYMDSFMHDNAINPVLFPALRKFENEVVSMTSHMLHGDDDVVGSVTSGGTESCLMAMKTHRDRARKLRPKIKSPNVVAPATIHPAFSKAAAYFDVTIKYVPVNQSTFTCDLAEYESHIDGNTILLLASAPSYPQAILDPISEISSIAVKHNLPLHVDACFGGYMLPWVDRLPGRNVPVWDFRLQGVTSISADLHKYAYATKGASCVLYRSSEIRKFQFFSFAGWSGGLFASPTMAGSRPGGHLAAAWVAMRSFGEEGYISMASKLMEVTEKMKDTINNTPGLKVLGNPLMTAFSFGSVEEKLNIFAFADLMEEKGWKIEVQRNPDCIHCTILPTHINSCDAYLKDLTECADYIMKNGCDVNKGQSAVYGMLKFVPNDGIVDNFLIDLFDEIYKV